MHPALAASFIRGTVDLIVSRHVVQAFATPVGNMFGLVNPGYILGDQGLAEHVEPFEDALVGEVQVTVTMTAVLLGGFLEGALLGDVALFVAVVAEVVVPSALKKRMLYWTASSWGQGHPVFGCHTHRVISHVNITYLFQCLHLLHPSLHPIHLHVDCKQGTQ